MNYFEVIKIYISKNVVISFNGKSPKYFYVVDEADKLDSVNQIICVSIYKLKINLNLFGIDSKEFKIKKYNNRKLDKIISLINYVISSSEKAIKYINSNNFEAEFAIKLYKSDKDNLLNELKNLSIEDIMESQRSN